MTRFLTDRVFWMVYVLVILIAALPGPGWYKAAAISLGAVAWGLYAWLTWLPHE
ncbi:MAG TPA: hypothetical protein VGY32_11560 [Solirubrobacteraceae bacterium]|nr:hypothetical protein [Solirubrobacteraceae bacterium]